MNILVCGGLGYIGSHVSLELIRNGYNVVIIDSLENGHIEALPTGVTFEKGDLLDISFVKDVFSKYKFDAVIDLCAYSIVSESVTNPSKYFNNNIRSVLNLLDIMAINNVKKIVFSSTAAVYQGKNTPILETDTLLPINPYGQSKLMVEEILKSYEIAFGIKHVVLRYFNACGADFDGLIGEAHNKETHLIPLVLDVCLKKRDFISIFGTDYNTFDGTCIRDYVHVTDLANAHIKAVNYLDSNDSDTFNIGTGKGTSVLEIVNACEKVTGINIPTKYEDRRAGDYDSLVASNEKAKNILKFTPKFTNLEEIIKSAWKFSQIRDSWK